MLLFAVGNLYFVLLNMATIIVLLSRASTLWLCVPLQFSFPFTVPPCSTPPPPHTQQLFTSPRESSSTSVTTTAALGGDYGGPGWQVKWVMLGGGLAVVLVRSLAILPAAHPTQIIYFQYGFQTDWYPVDKNQFSATLKNHLSYRITFNFLWIINVRSLYQNQFW